jgi:hypothetical protein
MKPGNWIIAALVSLLVFAGVAIDAGAQAPATAPETKQSAPESTPSQPAPSTQGEDKGSPAAPPPGARTDQPQQSAPGSTVIDRQVETRTERVEREPARILGVDPVIALIVGAVVLVVIILGMVAMSRREEEPSHRHTV